MKNEALENFLNEFLKFVDKRTYWKINNDVTNSQVTSEFLNRNEELANKFVASVVKPDLDTGSGLHLADVGNSGGIEPRDGASFCPECGCNMSLDYTGDYACDNDECDYEKRVK